MDKTVTQANEASPPLLTRVGELKVNGRSVVVGTELSIKGQPGRFRFVEYVVAAGAKHDWITVWGGSENHRAYRSFDPDRIRTVHRVEKLRPTK